LNNRDVPSNGQSSQSASSTASEKHAQQPPAVIIVGPPWPRSGSGAVIHNQIEFYRRRGYSTFFVAVAINSGYMPSNKALWDSIEKGVEGLGADRAVFAAFDRKKYFLTKCRASVRHRLRGTVLDWMVEIGRSAHLPDDIARYVRRLPVALIHVNHVFTMGFADRLRKQFVQDGGRVPLILETHDVQSHVLHERSEPNPWTRRPDRLERLIQSEKKMLDRADVLVHLSMDDFKFFKNELPSKPHALAMPTVDQAFITLVNTTTGLPPADTVDLLFVGQRHNPNLDALKWFFGQVWPLIADRRYSLKIVGAVDQLVRDDLPQIYEAFRSCFVGEVADLAPYYRAARCAIAPMVSGSGISIKTIEALALAKPFVGTPKAFRGMPMDQVERSGLRAYDTPEAFAAGIINALSNQHTQAALSRSIYDSLFSTEAAFASRDDVIRIARNVSRHEEAQLSSAVVPSR
jgi:polysaccharide biosynthesis protein PslH